jgi:subtilisin family serine protease
MVWGETRRARAASRILARLVGGRAAIAAGAIALAAVLALPAGPAAAHERHGHHRSDTNNNDDDDNGGGGAGGGGAAPPGASPAASLAGGGESNFGSPGNSNTGGGVSGSRGGGNGGGGGNLLGNNNGSHEPHARLGVNFNNDSASVSASVPLGGHHPAERPNDRITHPMFAIPFDHGANSRSLAHAFSPHVLSYGETGTPSLLGGTPRLTTRLIRSVTTTYSDHFVSHLGHSLRMQEPGGMQQLAVPSGGMGGAHDLASRLMEAKRAIATAAAPTRSLGGPAPAAVVNNRFAGAGIGANALDARVFTLPTPGETRFVSHEIVVGVPAGLSTEQIAEIARRHDLAPVAGGTVTDSGLTLQRWRITDDRPIGDVIRSLEAETGLQSAQPNFRFVLAQAAGLTEQPADGFSVQYAPEKLHLAQAHRLTTGGGVIVAVIDTGIDRTHPELAGTIMASFDAIGAKEPPDAHGTAIAGAIVAHGKLVGVAPGARLLAIRAFSTVGPDAEATTMTIVRSIAWAVAHGARVINMSFAGARDPLIGRALADARRHGVVLIAAAGNAGPSSPPLYPAADANVIAVSATDIDDHLLDVANRGPQVAIAAPGVDVLLPAPRGRYQIATGTSFAAAHVAGIAALMIARNPRLTPDDIRAELAATARDLGPKGRDDMFGAGLADAFKAAVAAAHGAPQTVATNGAAR